MPTSNLVIWPAILHLVHEVAPRRVLDVGPGHGKAGALLPEYVGRPPLEHLAAVEAWEPYVTDRLRCLYDEVLVGDVCELADHELATFDLVLMVDVLEHIDKQAGVDLLARIPGRIVICTPRDFFQNPEWRRVPPEEHRSLWSAPDFGGRVERDDAGVWELGAVLVRLAPLGGAT